jgi:hypothetical protein
MERLSDLLDPDVWINQNRSLLDFRMPTDDQDWRGMMHILEDNPELAARLGRWFEKMGVAAGEGLVGETLTEERLRALWEETRDGPKSSLM